MLEIAKIRQKTEEIAGNLARKGVANAADVLQEILRLDDRRKEIITELEKYRAEMNQTSKSIGLLMREGKKEEAEAAKKQTAETKDRIKELEQEVSEVQVKTKYELDELPNTPHASVPTGKSVEDNEVVFERG